MRTLMWSMGVHSISLFDRWLGSAMLTTCFRRVTSLVLQGMCYTHTIRTLYVEIEEGREGVADRQTHNANGIHTDLCNSNAVVSECLQCAAV